MAATTASTGQALQFTRTTLNYYLEPSKGGVEAFYDGAVVEKRRKHAEVPVTVTDIRGQEREFTLDKQGFQVVKAVSVEKTFDDVNRIKGVYYPESAELLKRMYAQPGIAFLHSFSPFVDSVTARAPPEWRS